jgi:hypothetical protein
MFPKVLSDQLQSRNMYTSRKPMPQLLMRLGETGKIFSRVPFGGFNNVTHKFTRPSHTITSTVV